MRSALPTQGKHLPALDGLQSFAILLVLWIHLFWIGLPSHRHGATVRPPDNLRIDHFWSLAVEEQCCVFCQLPIYLLRTRRRIPVAALLLATLPLFVAAAYLHTDI